VNEEIGSEFWISHLAKQYLNSNPEWLNSWGNVVLTSSGRGAISLMLKHIEVNVRSKIALLPAYICESIIVPFIRAGYRCYFYDVDNQLRPNEESIERLLGKDIGVFLHMEYFGFSTNSNLHYYINQLKERGTIIVEDITHTLYSKYRRYDENDYYIASLRKWMGLPSGGFLASKKYDICDINIKGVRECVTVQLDFFVIRLEALLLKGKYIVSKNYRLKQRYLDLFKKAEDILDNNPNFYLIDGISLSMVKTINLDELVRKRKENFGILLKCIKNFKDIQPVFDMITDDVCPLFFPVYVKEREKLRKFLITKKIYCPVHWPVPSQLNIINYPLSRKVYECILSIPCDQRYSVEDMFRIIEVISDYFDMS